MSERRGSPVYQRHDLGRDDDLLGSFPHDVTHPDATLKPESATPPPKPDMDLQGFAVEIQRTLDPQEVILVAVQELRPLLLCDRVCFLERRGARYRLAAVSGQPGRPRASRQATMLEQLVTAVMARGERFTYPADQLVLPDDLGRRLSSYWETANGQVILVEPIFSANPSRTPSPSKPRVVDALVIELFDENQLPSESLQRLDSAVQLLTPALANARKYSRLVTIPGLYHLGLIADGIRRSRSLTLLISLLLIGAAGTCAATIQSPLELECHGRLMPTVRREVFAGLEGEIVEVMVNESYQVQQGQIIARMQSPELEKLILEQTGSLKGKLKARDAARAELRSRSTPQGRGQSSRDQAQVETINAEIETIQRQLDLLEQEHQQLVIRAPISGTITTERPREKLLGRPVHRGESLLEIMDESGGWQLELVVAERKIGHLLAYRQQQSEPQVKFRLHASAQKSFDCTVARVSDRVVPSAELGACGVVFCNVEQLDLPTRQIGSEASARIQCGQRSLLFLWFHEFWEMLQRQWWM